MGFRYRKSVKMGPIRINFSKSGVGYSVGGKGFRVTKRADGKTQTTCSIPGTGISYVDVTGNKSKSIDNSYKHIDRNSKCYKVLKFMFKYIITGGLYLYYVMYKYIKRKFSKTS